MNRLLIILLSITFFLAFSSASALATPVTSLFYGDGSTNKAEDDDVEWLGYDQDEDGLLDVDDTLRGVFRVQEFNDTNIAPDGATSTGLSGVFEAQVTDKTEVGDGLFNFSFGPADYGTELFENEGSSMIALYETEPLENFDDPEGEQRTRDELIEDASDGTLLYEFGFTEENEYWTTSALPDDPSDAEETSASFGNFNTALNVTYNDFLPVLRTQSQGGTNETLYDLIGNGSISGIQGMNTSADFESDYDFQFATVPEPTTLLLFGTGLLGLAAFGRKRFMKK